jgi:hypothetical protein
MLHKALELLGSCELGKEPSGSIKGKQFLKFWLENHEDHLGG